MRGRGCRTGGGVWKALESFANVFEVIRVSSKVVEVVQLVFS